MPDVGLRNVQWKLNDEPDRHRRDDDVTERHADVTEHHRPVEKSPKLSKSKRPISPFEEMEGIVKNGKLDFDHILTNEEIEEKIRRSRKLSKSPPENDSSSSSSSSESDTNEFETPAKTGAEKRSSSSSSSSSSGDEAEAPPQPVEIFEEKSEIFFSPKTFELEESLELKTSSSSDSDSETGNDVNGGSQKHQKFISPIFRIFLHRKRNTSEVPKYASGSDSSQGPMLKDFFTVVIYELSYSV